MLAKNSILLKHRIQQLQRLLHFLNHLQENISLHRIIENNFYMTKSDKNSNLIFSQFLFDTFFLVFVFLIALLTQFYTEQQMFDMLDDDLDLGYIPTVANNNSRSGNMKKITKKEPKAPTKQPLAKQNTSKSKDFDDFFDDVLEKETKFLNGGNDKKQTVGNQKSKEDSLEMYFDDPKPKSLQNNKLALKQEALTNTPAKKAAFKMQASDQIISQDFGFSNSFGKPQITPKMQKVEKAEQLSFVSSRNMKPPIKKKDSLTNLQTNNLSLSIPQQQPKLTLASQKNDDQIIRPPPRLINRKPSAQKLDDLSINIKSESLNLPTQEKKETKKQQPFKNASKGLSLSFQEPNILKKQQKSHFSFSKEFKNTESQKPIQKSFKSFQPQPKAIQKPRQQEKKPSILKGLDLNVDQSVTWKQSPAPSQITQKAIIEDYQKQMQHLKVTFQKQIDFLQENLQKQITLNRQTRQKVIYESNKMIDDERNRSKKNHDQEITRIKDMLQWERNKMELSYKGQIQTLKQNLQLANRTNQHISQKTSANTKEDLSYLQIQLKSQKKILIDRQKILQKRQLDLQERQLELNKRKKKEQQRLRQQQKRILQLQLKYKKQFFQDKKILQQQKQQLAAQLANLQLQIMRKKEKAQSGLRENKLSRQAIEHERAELRLANAEVMSKYRAKMQDLQQQRQRVRNIEQQLIKKLRVLENKNRQLTMNKTNMNTCQKKQNNWIDDKNKSFNHGRAISVQRQSANQKSTANIKDTKERFSHLQGNARERIAIAVRDNKGFNLDNYMMTVDQYNKLRANVF